MTTIHLRHLGDDDTGVGGPGSGIGTGFQTRFEASAPTTLKTATSTATLPPTVLFLQEPGDTAAISVHDIHQGSLGDCFLLSSIGELALFDPSALSNMIHTNADGSETVSLYSNAKGQVPGFCASSFSTVQERVDNSFSTRAAVARSYGGQKETWVQVLEKSFAQEASAPGATNPYTAITYGGNPQLALEALTGQTAYGMSPSQVTADLLGNVAASHSLVVFDTRSGGNQAYGLVANHAYMFAGLTDSANGPAVVLDNPWGSHQPGAIPISQLSSSFIEVDVGHWA